MGGLEIRMDFLHIIMPLGDGISIEDIPQDVKDAAKKSVEMWEDYLEEETRHRIEERKNNIEKLKAELELAKNNNRVIPMPQYIESKLNWEKQFY